jgi:uncharacterized membrane protein YhaH (DUF805 family)
MSENNFSITRNSMNYGGMTGIALFLVFFISGLVSNSFSGILQMLGYLVLGIGIYIGTKSYRDTQLNGSISYGQSLFSGFLISFFAAVLISFVVFLYLKFIDSSMLIKMMDQTEIELRERYNDDDEKVDQALEIMQVMNNPPGYALMLILGYTFWGTLLSLVLAAFVKRDKTPGGSFDNFIQQNQ